jgi:hypothetical protein
VKFLLFNSSKNAYEVAYPKYGESALQTAGQIRIGKTWVGILEYRAG